MEVVINGLTFVSLEKDALTEFLYPDQKLVFQCKLCSVVVDSLRAERHRCENTIFIVDSVSFEKTSQGKFRCSICGIELSRVMLKMHAAKHKRLSEESGRPNRTELTTHVVEKSSIPKIFRPEPGIPSISEGILQKIKIVGQKKEDCEKVSRTGVNKLPEKRSLESDVTESLRHVREIEKALNKLNGCYLRSIEIGKLKGYRLWKLFLK